MSKALSGWLGFGACLMLLLAPSTGQCDFIVTNMLAEVGVSAGSQSDGVGGHNTTSASLSVMDGVPGTADFQLAEAEFLLMVEDDSVLADYVLTYETEALAMTGGLGNANALANGIIVFTLTEDFEVTGLSGETVFSDSMGLPVTVAEGSTQVFSAGSYSLSFGSSAIVNPNSPSFEDFNEQSGVVGFNSTAIPEPTTTSVCFVLMGMFGTRRRRS